jgi:hypothetical protein
MKVFFYMDQNPNNKSGVSWKMWKINRIGREVTVWWGPATVVRRRPQPVNTLQSKTWRFRTEAQAKEDAQRRIDEKLSKGYKKLAMR